MSQHYNRNNRGGGNNYHQHNYNRDNNRSNNNNQHYHNNNNKSHYPQQQSHYHNNNSRYQQHSDNNNNNYQNSNQNQGYYKKNYQQHPQRNYSDQRHQHPQHQQHRSLATNNNNNNNTIQHSQQQEKSPPKPKHTLAYEQLQEKFKNPEEVKQKIRESKRKHWEERSKQFSLPSSSIILKGLTDAATEDEIRNIVYRNYGLVATNVRVMRDKTSGSSRGFGFIDFENIEDSKSLVEITNGGMFVGNDYVELQYSHKNTSNQQQQETIYKDWICGHCDTKNFSNRVYCYGCALPRDSESKEVITTKDEQMNNCGDQLLSNQSSEETSNPTVELIVRGLNVMTTESTLLNVFNQYAPVKTCRIIRDRATLISRQFGFVEFFSVDDATKALTQSTGICIEGAYVQITYAKRQHIQGSQEIGGGMKEDETLASWSSLYNYTGTDENLAEKQKKIAEEGVSTNNNDFVLELEKNGYVYDDASGYYYNSQLNYYYDVNTGYYYDCSANYWMYYDQEKQVFVPFPSDSTGQEENNENSAVVAEDKMIGPTLPSASTANEKEEESIVVEEVIGSGGFVPNPTYEALKHFEETKEEIELQKLKSAVSVTIEKNSSLNNAVLASSAHKRKRKEEKEEKTITQPKEIGDENVGKKMLEKLGWNKGEGLGKNKTGITAPISVNVNMKSSGLGYSKGLGATNNTVQQLLQPTKKRKEDYQKEGMKAMQKRFSELDENNN
ncbi:hypothetical protein ABK040_004505 [Willaertia magna]